MDKIHDNFLVDFRDMHGIIEMKYMEKRNFECPIQVLDGNRYLVRSTGEVCEFDKSGTNRTDSYKSLKRTFRNLRYLINNNFFGDRNELFITLTYGGDDRPLISDGGKRFYMDFQIYIKALRRKYGRIEFVNVVEPHEDGHLHAHVLLKFFDHDFIFIPNDDMQNVYWKRGFTKTSNLVGVTNIGAYLSAYMTDVEVSEDSINDCLNANETIKIKNACGKKFIKGGRLKYYVKGFRIYRKSKGIKEPIFFDGKYSELKKRAGITCQKSCYSKSYQFATKDFSNLIIYEHFNLR